MKVLPIAAMGKAVQFTRAASLIREASRPDSSSVVLHELAHAYHDRVLGLASWNCASCPP